MSPPVTANGTHGLSIAVSSAIMVASVVVIFTLFIFFLILYLRSTLYTTHSLENSSIYFDGGGGGGPLVSRRALPSAVLKSLPISVFSSADFNGGGGIECAVCLSDLADGDHFRKLPVCNHHFHTDCIDIWFSSNSTCPICRSTVESPKTEVVKNGTLPPWIGMGPTAMPVNGSDEGSSSSAGLSRPGRIVAVQVNSVSSLRSGETLGTVAVEEVKLPAFAKSISSGCCSRGWDVEQGVPPPASPAEAGVIL